jgi:hypothetical protein
MCGFVETAPHGGRAVVASHERTTWLLVRAEVEPDLSIIGSLRGSIGARPSSGPGARRDAPVRRPPAVGMGMALSWRASRRASCEEWLEGICRTRKWRRGSAAPELDQSAHRVLVPPCWRHPAQRFPNDIWPLVVLTRRQALFPGAGSECHPARCGIHPASCGSAVASRAPAWPWRWRCRGSGSSATRRPPR